MVSTSGGDALSKLTEGEAGPQTGWTILEASGASAWGVIISGEESACFALHVLHRRCGSPGVKLSLLLVSSHGTDRAVDASCLERKNREV